MVNYPVKKHLTSNHQIAVRDMVNSPFFIDAEYDKTLQFNNQK